MEKVARLTAEQREDLVAYLDGELEDVPSQEIDRILARSDVARHEVEALSRAWEMLDILPRSNASSEFTSRTMATVKLEEVPHDFSGRPWFIALRRGAVGAVWVAALAAAGLLGFLATWQWYPNPNRDLLEELPVVKQLDVYAEVDNPEFLESLSKSALFDGGDDASPQP